MNKCPTVAHRGRRNADECLAFAVASGQTLRDAAWAAGVSEPTAARRWADPAFRSRVTQVRGETFARASGQLADAMTPAVAALSSLLTAETDSVRLAAAPRTGSR
jgi:hypothetical protein